MPRNMVGRLGAAILGCGLLLVPVSAHAETVFVGQPEYEAAYAAAADASPVFAPDTTVTFSSRGAEDGDMTVTVNTDGSLVGSRQRDGTPVDVRCVRVDRCWENSPGWYGDRKWHRLTRGAVNYQLARDFWSAWMGFPWPPGSVFAMDTQVDGSPFFLVGVPIGDLVVVNGTSFTGPEVQNVIITGIGDDLSVDSEGRMTAVTAIRVTPPGKRATGTPAPELRGAEKWLVPLNQPQ